VWREEEQLADRELLCIDVEYIYGMAEKERDYLSSFSSVVYGDTGAQTRERGTTVHEATRHQH
jgi:hypothetical protein